MLENERLRTALREAIELIACVTSDPLADEINPQWVAVRVAELRGVLGKETACDENS